MNHEERTLEHMKKKEVLQLMMRSVFMEIQD